MTVTGSGPPPPPLVEGSSAVSLAEPAIPITPMEAFWLEGNRTQAFLRAAARLLPLSPAEGEYSHDGPGHDDQVEADRLVLDVVEVVAELHTGVVDAAPVAGVHLSPSGQARTDREPGVVEVDFGAELFDVLGLLGTRSDQ